MPKLLTQGVSLEPKTGRQLIGIVAGFKSELWPVIDRNAGRLQLGIRKRPGCSRDRWGKRAGGCYRKAPVR